MLLWLMNLGFAGSGVGAATFQAAWARQCNIVIMSEGEPE